MSPSTTPLRGTGSGASSGPADAAGSAADRLLTGVGTRLAAARRHRGVTLAVVAGRSGLSPAYVSQIESGAANPTLRALTQLAAAVGVRVSELFGAAPARNERPDPPFAPRVSRAALAHSVAGAPGVWEHTAAGSTRLVTRLVHGDAADHASPTTHAGEEYVLVLYGSCRLRVDGTDHELRTGDACHFPAGVEHHLHDASPDLTLSVVMSTP